MSLGPELIEEGGFIGGLNEPPWYNPLGEAVYNNDSVILNLSGTTFTVLLIQDYLLGNTENGKTYRVQFDYLDIGTNNITKYIAVGVGTNDFTPVYCSVGHQSVDVVADIPDPEIGQFKFFNGQRGSTVEITNVSVREVLTDTNLYLQTVQMVGAETGDVQTINAGKSDDGTPIYYELQTQEIEFGNRAHLKSISDLVVVLNEFGIDSSMEARENRGDFKPIPMSLSEGVNIGKDVNLDGNYFTFKWSGVASDTSPIFQGIGLEGVQDLGITKK